MQITEAKRELYNELRKTDKSVAGAGIKEEEGCEVIVIYIIGIETNNSAIPHLYKGIKVITEVVEDPKMI